MDNQQLLMFKGWFIDSYPECKDYLDLTYFDVEKSSFIAKCSYNPDSGIAAKVLRIAFGSWQHQQAKVEELQEEFAEDERFLKEQIKDKDLKISNLEYQQGMDKELIQTLQCKVEKLQKQIDALEKSYFVLARIKSIASKNLLESILIKEVRQALKGEGQ
ncbi:TPA: hypothetical protein ACIFDD_003313 [Acinetobacter baumannii]|nr:hypothetical protein [Acinetobacter baumannii]